MTPVQARVRVTKVSLTFCIVQSLSPPLYSMPRLVSLSPSTTPSPSPSPFPSPSHCAPMYRRLTRLPSTTIPSLAAPAPTAFSLVNQAPKNSHLPNSTMVEREPRSTHTNRNWSNIPSEILDLFCSCMDILSTVRLAASSRDMHAAIVEVRSQLLNTPFFLLSSLARFPHHDTELYMMPLDFNLTSIRRNFFACM